MPFLHTTKNKAIQKEIHPLASEITIVGRQFSCDIVIDHGTVSREHACVIAEPDGFYLEDLHSRNGTILNGKPVHARTRLSDGDKIKFSEYEFIFSEAPSHSGLPVNHSNLGEFEGVTVDDDADSDSGYNITSRINYPGVTSSARLSHADIKLRALVDIGRNLGGVMSEVLPQLLDNLLKIFPQADCAYILLMGEESKQLELKAFKHRSRQQEALRISRSILEKVASTKTSILSNSIGDDSRFDPSESIAKFKTTSVLASPMVDPSRGECLGVIQVDSRSGCEFTHNELDLLASIALQMAVAIQNTILNEIRAAESLLKRDLSVAIQVQRSLLPLSQPEVEGYEFFDYYQAAKMIGGDYFDYVPMPGGELAIAVGDVSGKGISASLLMVKLSAEVRHCLLIEETLPLAMQRLNRIFSDARWEYRFITFLLAVLNPQTGLVRFLNAGHLAPIWIRPEGETAPFGQESSSFPLGVVEDADYSVTEIVLAPGESLAILSDGLTDAVNSTGDYYDLPQVINTLTRSSKEDVLTAGRNLIASIRNFAGKNPQSDDQTLVIVRRKK